MSKPKLVRFLLFITRLISREQFHISGTPMQSRSDSQFITGFRHFSLFHALFSSRRSARLASSLFGQRFSALGLICTSVLNSTSAQEEALPVPPPRAVLSPEASIPGASPGSFPDDERLPIFNSQSSVAVPPSRFAAPPSPHTPATPDQGFVIPAFADQIVENPLRWGPFDIIPAINYRFSYSTGLPRAGLLGADETTVQHAVAPSLTLQSKHLTLSYSPSLNYYAKGRYDDSVNHAASLSSSFGYGDWRFGLSHSYSAASRVLVETARQTDTERHGTALTASYQLSDKTSLDLTASQNISEASGLNSSKTWSTMNWFNYQVTDITLFGVGVGGGYSDVELGSDMTYEQIQARVHWAPRPKIEVDVNGGVDIRQFLGQSGSGDRVSPIIGASASYRPFDQTTVSLNADRSVSASLFADQITETTSFDLSIRQRFFERLQAGLSGGFRFVDYQSTSRLLEAGRSDDVTFFSASLGTRILKKGNISVSYSHSDNRSNREVFTYDSDTFAVQVGYRF
jgi:hypothetical protein